MDTDLDRELSELRWAEYWTLSGDLVLNGCEPHSTASAALCYGDSCEKGQTSWTDRRRCIPRMIRVNSTLHPLLYTSLILGCNTEAREDF